MPVTLRYIDSKTFQSSQSYEIAQMSQQIFSGFFSFIQTVKVQISYIALAAILMALLFLWQHAKDAAYKKNIILFYATSLSLLFSIRISHGWDEFFLNLRHSYWLMKGAGFSANGLERIEATGDFLPFAFVGIIGKWGIPTIDVAICVSLLGNILCIFASYSIAKCLTKNTNFSLVCALLMAFFPGLLFIGASGFMAGLYSGLLLWIIHDILIVGEKKILRGMLLMSVLCLFRMEGILFTAAMWISLLVLWRKNTKLLYSKVSVFYGVLTFLPFLSLHSWRYFYFGYAIPVPVVFKASLLNTYYWKMGLLHGISVFAFYKIHLVFLVLMFLYLCGRKFSIKLENGFRTVIPIIILMLFLVLPYQIGGGDWFPKVWARYELPFLIFLYLSLWIILFLFFESRFQKHPITRFICSILILSPFWFGAIDIAGRKIDFSIKASAFSSLLHDLTKSENRWDRLDKLAALGHFFRKTLPPHSVIASSEMATLFYFSETEILDLTGIVNREIASSPVDPMITYYNPMVRRRLPTTIEKNRPAAIALYEPFGVYNITEKPLNSDQMVNLLLKQNFTYKKIAYNHYRMGDLSRLKYLGYQHLALFINGTFFNYWVHVNYWKNHLDKLLSLGLTQKTDLVIPYEISQEFEKKYR